MYGDCPCVRVVQRWYAAEILSSVLCRVARLEYKAVYEIDWFECPMR
jgi:hypothetical protein